MFKYATFVSLSLLMCLFFARCVENNPKYAYATIHYEGTPQDDAYLLGIRVLIHSIKLSGTKHDIIVLVHSSVKESTREILSETGAKLINVDPIENPFGFEVVCNNIANFIAARMILAEPIINQDLTRR